MDRQRLDKWCERGILALVLGILVFGPLATGAVRALEFLVIQALAIGVALLWLIRFWVNPRLPLLWPPICWSAVAFLVYAVARYFTADIEYVARQELIRIIVYAVVFFAALNNLHRQGAVQIITFSLIAVGAVMSFLAFYQFVTNSNVVPSLGAWIESKLFPEKTWFFIKPYQHRGTGTYFNPNHLAGFLEMLLLPGLAYALVGRQKPVGRVLLGYASLVMVAGIGVTLSRGSWVATSITLVLFFGLLFLRRQYRIPSLVLLLVLLVGSAHFLSRTYHLQKRLHEMREGLQVETGIRYQLWDATLRMWLDHFWWGVGPGHYDHCFRPYRPDAIQLRPDRAHNEYLNTLADWGLVGTMIVASAWVLLYVGVFKTWRHVRRPDNEFAWQSSNKFAFVLGCSLGLLALLLHSVVEFNMHIPANAILAVSLMALLAGHVRFATDRYWISVRLPMRLLVTAVLAVICAYLSMQGWRRAKEYVWLEHAARAESFSRAQIAALEKAHAIEPMNFETTYAIGEAYRVQSWQGNDDYEDLARKAMEWFAKGMKLNPHDGYNHLRYGMCLDWIGEHAQAEAYYARAEDLDPNGYFTLANIGWHYVQIGNYAAAKEWFERSRQLESQNNPIATSYADIVRRKLLENAAADNEPAAGSPSN